jgi:adenylate cyclase
MYSLRTFGGFVFEEAGAPLDGPAGQRKAMALLTVLAAEGAASRDRLALLLWPDSDTERARGSLKQTLHLLRRRTGVEDLVLGTNELRLNPDRIRSDVEQFSRAVDAGDLEAAVGHYTGPFLDGVHLDRSRNFEEWVDAQRLALGTRYTETLERLARAAAADGDHATAAAWWQKVQTQDPLNGRSAVQLMLALEASGNPAAALQHARVHELLLREQWELEPDREVVELASRIRAGDRTAAAPRTRDAGSSLVERSQPAAAESLQTRHAGRRPHWRAAAAVVAVVATGAALWLALSDARPGRMTRVVAAESGEHGAAEPGSIAVLPFVDLSPDADAEYFGDGIAEELIGALGRVPGLKVVARTSAFQFKGRAMDVREVGRQLNVRHVLEGSVRKDATALRITTRLVEVAGGYNVWTHTYDRSLDDAFAIQDEIAMTTVAALRAEPGVDPASSLVSSRTPDAEAYEMYLKGLHFYNRLQIAPAIEQLQAASRRDPSFARAHAALAVALGIPAAHSDLAPEQARAQGIDAARAALRLDPSLAEAHAALGWLEMIDLEWGAAERSLQRAIGLNPELAQARLHYAFHLHRQGRTAEAVDEADTARRLDPLSLSINVMLASFLADAGHTEDAVARVRATLELDESFPMAHAMLGHMQMGAGQLADAIRSYERAAQVVPTSYYLGFLGHGLARAGRTAEAARMLGSLTARHAAGEHVSPGAIGWILLGLDQRDEAFGWLNRAAENRDPFLTIYGVLSSAQLSAPYRSDPRFETLRRRVFSP